MKGDSGRSIGWSLLLQFPLCDWGSAEHPQCPHFGVVVLRRWRDAANDPVDKVGVGVGVAKHDFELVKLSNVKTRKGALVERAEDEIAFLRSTMAGSDEEIPSSQLGERLRQERNAF